MNQKDVDRFWSKVDKTGDCWLWLGTVSNGHGIMSVGKGPMYAVRIAWELVRGIPPQPRINLRRTCDTPLCVNPDHREPFVKQFKPALEKVVSTKPFSDIPDTPATYYILNRVNHRIYVGTTRTLQSRFRSHLSSLHSNNHTSSALQTDWNKYGAESFEFGVLVEGCYPAGSNPPYSGQKPESFEDIFVRAYQSDNPGHGYNIGHFEDRPGFAYTHLEKLNQLADLWNIGGRRRDSETIRRCIDYTYQHFFSQQSPTLRSGAEMAADIDPECGF